MIMISTCVFAAVLIADGIDVSLRLKPDMVQRFFCSMEIDDTKEKVILKCTIECRVMMILPNGGYREKRVFDSTRMKVGNDEVDVPMQREWTGEFAADGTLLKASGKKATDEEATMWALVSLARPSSYAQRWSHENAQLLGSKTKHLQKSTVDASTLGTDKPIRIDFESSTDASPAAQATGSIWIDPQCGWTRKLDATLKNVKLGKAGAPVTIHLKLEPI